MFVALVLAAAIWPSDAHLKVRKVSERVEMHTVSIIRRCPDLGESSEFTFEYPLFRGRMPAVVKINAAIHESFGLKEELSDCPIPLRAKAGSRHASVDFRCSSGAPHGDLVTINCTRGYTNENGRSGGYRYFLVFDRSSGRKLAPADLVSELSGFREMLRKQLLSEYKDEIPAGVDDDWTSELLENLSRECGVLDNAITCTHVMGMHGWYDVSIPIPELCPLLRREYFAADCPEPK